MQQGNKTTAPEIDFGEFAPATYAEWREAAVAALKGADFDKKLFTKLVEGITLHPIYNKWDEHSPVMPAGQFPYRRGTRALGYMEKPCEIAQSIPASSPEDFNAKLLHDLERGLTAVNIQLNCKCGLKLRKQADWGYGSQGRPAGRASRICHSRFLRPGNPLHVPEHLQGRRRQDGGSQGRRSV